MRYFIIAGEASGDLHAANLIRQIRLRDKEAVCVGMGGDKMAEVGCDLLQHYRHMAYMGIVAVLQNLPSIRKNFAIAHRYLLDNTPDVLILIDYPSFNLKVASFCKKHLPNTKICYYIPPKIWAWKSWRVHTIARLCDMVLGIFPFEPAFYAQRGYSCKYVGNPTQDSIRAWKESLEAGVKGDDIPKGGERAVERERTIALLPGSRRSEISHCLPTMLRAAMAVSRRLSVERGDGEVYRIVVTAAPSVEDSFYTPYLQACNGGDIVLSRATYAVVSKACAAVVNSGTATLETALLGCPQTAVYYIACSKWLEWLLRPIVFRIPHFTLVNILLDRCRKGVDSRSSCPAIEELVASRFTQANIEKELYRLLTDGEYRERMLQDYREISAILGDTYAAESAAAYITNTARE